MRYEIRYLPTNAEMQPANYEIICQDNEARALMKEINRELRLMERGRRREMRHRIKDALRVVPHKPMQKRKNIFSFEAYQIDDVGVAARRLIGRSVRAGFLGSMFNITLHHIEDLEAMLASKAK